MDNPLRYALVIEVGDLFAEVKVLHQRRTAQSGLQRVLIVGNLDALVCAHHLAGLNGVEIGERQHHDRQSRRDEGLHN
jgi:hypothetical protein